MCKGEATKVASRLVKTRPWSLVVAHGYARKKRLGSLVVECKSALVAHVCGKRLRWCFHTPISLERCQGARSWRLPPDPQRPFAPDDPLLAPEDPPTTCEARASPFATLPTTGPPFPLYPFEASPFRRAAALPSTVRHHQPLSMLNFSE